MANKCMQSKPLFNGMLYDSANILNPNLMMHVNTESGAWLYALLIDLQMDDTICCCFVARLSTT